MQIRTTLGLAVFLVMGVACAPAYAQHGGHGGHGHDKHQGGGEKERSGHSHEGAELHGGEVVMTESHHFEVVFRKDELRVYVYGKTQKAQDPKNAGGSVALRGRSGAKGKLALAYVGPDAKTGRSQGYLRAAHSFAGTEKGALKATFELSGLPGAAKTARFVATYAPSADVGYACPMGCVKHQEDPGRCPKCGMTLKKKEGDHHGGDGDDDDGDHKKGGHHMGGHH